MRIIKRPEQVSERIKGLKDRIRKLKGEKVTDKLLYELVKIGGTIVEQMQANFPYKIAGWIDVHNQLTVAAGATGTILNYNFVSGRRGVIKWYWFYSSSGGLANITFRMTHNSMIIPINEGIGTTGDVITTYALPFQIHVDLQPNDELVMQAVNNTAAVITVAGGVKGWYY